MKQIDLMQLVPAAPAKPKRNQVSLSSKTQKQKTFEDGEMGKPEKKNSKDDNRFDSVMKKKLSNENEDAKPIEKKANKQSVKSSFVDIASLIDQPIEKQEVKIIQEVSEAAIEANNKNSEVIEQVVSKLLKNNLEEKNISADHVAQQTSVTNETLKNSNNEISKQQVLQKPVDIQPVSANEVDQKVTSLEVKADEITNGLPRNKSVNVQELINETTKPAADNIEKTVNIESNQNKSELAKNQPTLENNISEIDVDSLNKQFRNNVKNNIPEVKETSVSENVSEELTAKILPPAEQVKSKNENDSQLNRKNVLFKVEKQKAQAVSKQNSIISELKDELIVESSEAEPSQKFSLRSVGFVENKKAPTAKDENNIFASALTSKSSEAVDISFKPTESDTQPIDRISAVNQIVEKIQISRVASSKEITVDLNPVELGSVKIQLTMQNNELSGKILVENSKTFSDLSKQTEELVAKLSDTGLTVKEIQIEMSPEEFSQENTGQPQAQMNNNSQMQSESHQQDGKENLQQNNLNLHDRKNTERYATELESSPGYVANDNSVDIML